MSGPSISLKQAVVFDINSRFGEPKARASARDTLRRVVSIAVGSGNLSAEDTIWLRRGFAAVLAGDQGNFEIALGLGGPGKRRLSVQLAREVRDELLRRAAEVLAPRATRSQQARILHDKLALYFDTAWRNGEADLNCTPHQAGSLRAIFWEILNRIPAVPSNRQIREILAANNGLFAASE